MIKEIDGEALIKLLSDDGFSTFQKSRWNLPRGEKRALKMRKIRGRISPCYRGYHVTTIKGAMQHWIQSVDDVFWMVEIGDEYIEHSDKYVSAEARILGKLPDDELPKDIEAGKRIVDNLMAELQRAWKNKDIEFAQVNTDTSRIKIGHGNTSYLSGNAGPQKEEFGIYLRNNDAFISALARYASSKLENTGSVTIGNRGALNMIINTVVRYRLAVAMGAIEDDGILKGMKKAVKGMKVGKLYTSYDFTRNEPF